MERSFQEMRLEEEQSQREPFDARDLQTIFNAPLLTEHKLPWARRERRDMAPVAWLFRWSPSGRIRGLRVSDIREDDETGVPLMWFTRDLKAGRN